MGKSAGLLCGKTEEDPDIIAEASREKSTDRMEVVRLMKWNFEVSGSVQEGHMLIQKGQQGFAAC